MKVLLKQAHIICSRSPFHGQVKDILIINGIIKEIADNIQNDGCQIIESQQLHVSIGWMDLFVQFADPGYEFRETITTGTQAAAAGGFTDVMVVPNTKPAIDSKSSIDYIIQQAAKLPVNVYPIGSVSKNNEGKELAEMYDMYNSGAKVFSDGKNAIQHAGLMIKALQYVNAKKSLIIQVPEDKSIAAHGLINEGIISTQLGLPGIPSIAEELMIARDIELLKYTDSSLHITGVSTQKGVDLILAAKRENLNISFSVTPYHCYFCDEDLADYDTHLKVNPPLRTREDMMAIRKAAASGIADCISSHHTPLHWDDKSCEFEYAKNGMIGLETLFGVMNSLYTDLSTLIAQLSENPKNITGVSFHPIDIDAVACLTFFDPSISFTFEEKMIKSTSKNSPFIGKKLKGKALGIINKNQLITSL